MDVYTNLLFYMIKRDRDGSISLPLFNMNLFDSDSV